MEGWIDCSNSLIMTYLLRMKETLVNFWTCSQCHTQTCPHSTLKTTLWVLLTLRIWWWNTRSRPSNSPTSPDWINSFTLVRYLRRIPISPRLSLQLPLKVRISGLSIIGAARRTSKCFSTTLTRHGIKTTRRSPAAQAMKLFWRLSCERKKWIGRDSQRIPSRRKHHRRTASRRK